MHTETHLRIDATKILGEFTPEGITTKQGRA